MIECSFPLVALAKRSAVVLHGTTCAHLAAVLGSPTIQESLNGLVRLLDALVRVFAVLLVFAVLSFVIFVAQVILLFTDGLVETATRDIALGIDKLAGLGEGMLQRGFDGAAERTVSAITHTNDDRALIVVHRRW